MAFPVILIDSATGSDTAASGAGPSTALTNNAAATNVAGTTVTLNAGTVLTGVAVDGSAVIYINDTVAGHRRFSKITATSGSGGATPTVTVAEAFTGSLSGKTWAIGGKRASLGSASSLVLTDNNNGDGDAMPGWVLEFQTGHTETFAGSVNFYRSGDATIGLIITRGATGTPPVLTFSGDTNGFIVRGNFWMFSNLDGRNTNASKTVSTFIVAVTSQLVLVLVGLKVAHATNRFYRPLQFNGPEQTTVLGCELGYGVDANVYIDNNITTGLIYLAFNYIHHCTSHGVNQFSDSADGFFLHGNIIAANGGRGVIDANHNTQPMSTSVYTANTFDGNTSHGVEVSVSNPPYALQIANNIFSNNGGYGLNFSNGSVTAALLDALGMQLLNNCFYNNTSGKYNPTGLTSRNEITTDPTYTNRAGNDYSVGPNMAGKGYPVGGVLPIGTTSATQSYVDLGAAQRAATGGGLLVNPGMTGGMN